MSADRARILAALSAIRLPSGSDIVAAGMVRALTVEGGKVRFVLEIPAGKAAEMTPLRDAARARLEALEGIDEAQIVMTAPVAAAPPPELRARRAEASGPQPLPGVAHVIAVASGKGGVGKSTVAANLAVALAAEGRRVGLLDADVYGPSQPRMMGITGRPSSPDGKTILPLRNHGVTLMSIGLMAAEDEALIWRGPMLMGALQQMLAQVQWGALDILLVDLPPGTGDVQMTLAQKTRLDGAIVVSTPQDVALIDVRKGIAMLRKMGVPILGLVENMSTHVCSKCGHEEHLFGHGGVAAEAKRIGAPLLAEIPLDLGIRLAGDGGAPIVAAQPDSAQARAFRALAARLVGEGVA
ncbi:Mrp/NBP35 family ATP-binding protein [Albidovulum sp.]